MGISPTRPVLFKAGLLIFAAFLAITAASCASGKVSSESDFTSDFTMENWTVYKPAMEDSDFVILNYRGKEAGRPIPAWIAAWVRGGEKEIEAMRAYNGKYCFVTEQFAGNLDTLLKWISGFNPEDNFHYVIIDRVFKRWTANISASPDAVYGNYFVNMLKSCSASKWSDVENEGRFWLYVRYRNPEANEESSLFSRAQEYQYMGLVLSLIDKTKFQSRMNSIFNSIDGGKQSSHAQTAAASALVSNFWTGF